MRLGTRIFICYLLISVVCFYYPIRWFLDDLRTRYLEALEEPLVDLANILASIVEVEMERESFDKDGFYDAFQRVYQRILSARIYTFIKSHIDVRVYMTDLSGKIIFDSVDINNEGADYSKWRDVILTLKGLYGARTTRTDVKDKNSSVLYVAAPINKGEEIIGVLTVVKPVTNINEFLNHAKSRIIKVCTISLIIVILLSYLVSIWLTRPIKRLTRYAINIGQGDRADFPKLDKSEIGEMGRAFGKMQDALEGKRYVEHYIQTLTHEIKSPLSAIRGAGELMEEDMPPDQRVKFLSNIRNETGRIQSIVDRMLELSVLENQRTLERVERISLTSLVMSVLESKGPILLKRDIEVRIHVKDDVYIKGDSFLLHQALSNLLQNSIDFSPHDSQIDLNCHVDTYGTRLVLMIEDQGAGIPDFALEKVFNKFFSLQRPEGGKKSTGLGLNLVREVILLHKGDIKLENREKRGARAILTLPSTDSKENIT